MDGMGGMGMWSVSSAPRSMASCEERATRGIKLRGAVRGISLRAAPLGDISNAAAPLGGISNAARVSRGTEVDLWPGLTVKEPKRNQTERVTVTVVIYNTVMGGVPTVDDVAAAIDDLEALYEACGVTGKLADQQFDFMKKELTVKDAHDIATKLTYQPPSTVVTNHDVFPS